MAKKLIKVMDTSFRDGFQSIYGAKVLVDDFLPALKAAVDAGLKHFETAGGARFQVPIFFCNENAFETMDKMREAVGPDVKLQSLSRGVNVVGLNSQPRDVIDLHAKMFAKHGVNVIRNFDALNDVNNLIDSANSIKKHGLDHEVTITMMELPYGCEGAHDVAFYERVLRNILDAGIPFDSLAFKDASGTSNPRKVYETVKMAREILGSDAHIRFHSHETAGTGLAAYLAALDGGADGIDLAMKPVSGGTGQPDIISMWHALKGTDFDLGIDIQGTEGSQARVIFNGVVTTVFQQGKGQIGVLVRHGKYISVYCNLSEIAVKKGDELKTGDIIGNIHKSDNGQRILHFQLHKETAKLNPMDWLRR